MNVWTVIKQEAEDRRREKTKYRECVEVIEVSGEVFGRFPRI